MKMIAVQTIIYDVYLARTGNCDIGTSASVKRWDRGSEAIWYGTVLLHGAIVKRTENRVIVNV